MIRNYSLWTVPHSHYFYFETHTAFCRSPRSLEMLGIPSNARYIRMKVTDYFRRDARRVDFTIGGGPVVMWKDGDMARAVLPFAKKQLQEFAFPDSLWISIQVDSVFA